jgi:hypothetical protein
LCSGGGFCAEGEGTGDGVAIGGGDPPGDGVRSGRRPGLQVLGDGVVDQPRLALLDLPGRSSDHDLGSHRDRRFVERQDHCLWGALQRLLVRRVGGDQRVVCRRRAGACPNSEHCPSNDSQQPIPARSPGLVRHDRRCCPACAPGEANPGHDSTLMFGVDTSGRLRHSSPARSRPKERARASTRRFGVASPGCGRTPGSATARSRRLSVCTARTAASGCGRRDSPAPGRTCR